MTTTPIATNIPVLAAGGVTAAGSNQLLPLRAVDQAVLALNTPDFAHLKTAFWASLRKSGFPVDMMSASPYGLGGSATLSPTILSPDAAFGGEDSIDFGTLTPVAAATSAMKSAQGTYTQSWTMILVFATRDNTSSGPMAYATNSSNAYGGGISHSNTQINVQPTFGGASTLLIPRSRFYESAANILVVSADANTQQAVGYLNGLTPMIGTAGQGAYPTLSGTGWWTFGGTGGSDDGCRFSRGYTCDVSLYHTTGGQARIRSIIAAAATDFGITLLD